MGLKNYGVLKGTIAGHLRDADDDHYQILIHAAGEVFRIACNVKSSAPKAPSTLLFLAKDSLPSELKRKLADIQLGFTRLQSLPATLAIDYLRGGLVETTAMSPVPPDSPGADNDLKDKLETAVIKAIKNEGSILYAFGAKWGPEKRKPDKYFKFLPGQGVHDIHMNQGNAEPYMKDNGIYQDGCLIFQYPQDKWSAFFFAFQSQTFHTDDQGDPII